MKEESINFNYVFSLIIFAVLVIIILSFYNNNEGIKYCDEKINNIVLVEKVGLYKELLLNGSLSNDIYVMTSEGLEVIGGILE